MLVDLQVVHSNDFVVDLQPHASRSTTAIDLPVCNVRHRASGERGDRAREGSVHARKGGERSGRGREREARSRADWTARE